MKVGELVDILAARDREREVLIRVDWEDIIQVALLENVGSEEDSEGAWALLLNCSLESQRPKTFLGKRKYPAECSEKGCREKSVGMLLVLEHSRNYCKAHMIEALGKG